MEIAVAEGHCPADGCVGELRNGMPGRFEKLCTGTPTHVWKKHDLIWMNYRFLTREHPIGWQASWVVLHFATEGEAQYFLRKVKEWGYEAEFIAEWRAFDGAAPFPAFETSDEAAQVACEWHHDGHSWNDPEWWASRGLPIHPSYIEYLTRLMTLPGSYAIAGPWLDSVASYLSGQVAENPLDTTSADE